MEPDIKRINFFDGLFLKEGEFLQEQLYHLHMRRRINYMLFETSGVVQIETGDLRVTPTTAKRFHVTPGMAVSHRPDLKEGREVILTANSAEFDLAALGFSGADEAVVAVHYEDGLSEPQTGVDPATETRIDEQAVVTVHDAADPWPPAPLPNGENYIKLGHIAFSTMSVTESVSERHSAIVRSALFGGAPPSSAPTISSMVPSSGLVSTAVAVHITGTNLSGANVTTDDPAATVSGVVATATTIDFTLTMGATVSTFTITVNTGVPPATTRAFTIGSPAATPVIAFLSPAQQASGATVNIHGTDIRNTGLAVGVPAAGTIIRLSGGANTKTVPAVDTEVRPDAGGNQVVRFEVPDRSGTSWGTTETVSLELEFNGGISAPESFQYDD